MFDILINDITLDKKEFINSFLKNDHTGNSEHTFTNLFMWRKSYNIKYSVISGCLCIMSGHSRAKKQFSIIPGDGGNIKNAYKEAIEFHLEKYGDFLIRICDKSDFETVKELYPDKFHLAADPANSDYIYETAVLSALKGKKYHAKRNFVNRFELSYSFCYEEMTPEYKEGCKKLYLKWFNERKDAVPGLNEELEAVWELLDNWESLDITGGCIKSEGEIIAFSFGEPFIGREDMAVIHLEHADMNYTGAFQAINKYFLENTLENFRYVNREEDMGLEGLRKSKQSYYPCFMIEKYYAVHNLSVSEI